MTKNVPVERIREAFEAGIRDLGENRVQELVKKKTELPAEIRWHFIGHLQTNKVKSVLGETALLHSLDRIALAEEIQKQAQKRNLTVDTLVQVNTSGEMTKSGFQPEEVEEALERLKSFDRIRIRGLMTIAPTSQDPVRDCFRRLLILRDKIQEKFSDLDLYHLSMGMSSDFEIAVEEGATILRIGTAVFGERKKVAENAA